MSVNTRASVQQQQRQSFRVWPNMQLHTQDWQRDSSTKIAALLRALFQGRAFNLNSNWPMHPRKVAEAKQNHYQLNACISLTMIYRGLTLAQCKWRNGLGICGWHLSGNQS